MAALAASKLKVVQTLVETAPDAVVRSLELALSAEAVGQGPLSAVRTLVETEAADRFLRNIIFAPVAPLFAPGVERLAFPSRSFSLMWKGVKRAAPELVQEAVAHCGPWDAEEADPEVLDALCGIAAQGLRDGIDPDFRAAVELCKARGQGEPELIVCLDLAPLVRSLLPQLSDWVSRMTPERTAAARVAYRDAAEMHADGGPLLFEMLAAALQEPWLILRVISAVMDKPHESYLAQSELARFGERVLHDIESCAEHVRKFSPQGGAEAGRRAGQQAQRAIAEMSEFEHAIETARNGAWGARLFRQREVVIQLIESYLAAVDNAVSQALPIEGSRLSGLAVRGAPRLSKDPDERLVAYAEGLLAFSTEVRTAASNGGFSSARSKMLDKINARLDNYTDYLLSLLRHEEVEDRERVRRYLEIAADFIAHTRDEKTAQIIRRRAAAV